MTAPYTGGCACGAIRYEIVSEPLMSVHCQCLDCQRITGTGHASFLAFPAAQARLVGTPKFHGVTADSGNTASRGFCTNCGSFVVAMSTGFPDFFLVSAGSLDDPSRFAPQAVVYASRAQRWDVVDSNLTRFPKLPPPSPSR